MWTWHISVLIKALSHAAALAFLKWGRKQTGSFQLRIVDRQRCSIWAGFIPSLPWRRLSVVACVHVCVLANIRSHGRTGTPLRAAGHFLCKVLTGSLIFTHTHTEFTASPNAFQQLLSCRTFTAFWTGTQSPAATQHCTKVRPWSYCSKFNRINHFLKRTIWLNFPAKDDAQCAS